MIREVLATTYRLVCDCNFPGHLHGTNRCRNTGPARATPGEALVVPGWACGNKHFCPDCLLDAVRAFEAGAL